MPLLEAHTHAPTKGKPPGNIRLFTRSSGNELCGSQMNRSCWSQGTTIPRKLGSNIEPFDFFVYWNGTWKWFCYDWHNCQMASLKEHQKPSWWLPKILSLPYFVGQSTHIESSRKKLTLQSMFKPLQWQLLSFWSMAFFRLKFLN